jgi:hypothetical protein
VEIGLLQAVLRIGVVAQDAARCPVELAVVPPHDELQSLGVAASDPRRELSIGKVFQGNL